MKRISVLALAAALVAASASAQNKLTVITTTEDLASIGREELRTRREQAGRNRRPVDPTVKDW